MGRDKTWWKSFEPNAIAYARKRSERIRDSLQEIEPCTLPLYLPKKLKGEPELIATGVLLSIGECVFLLTAAHAIEHFNGYPILLPIGGRFVPVSGESYRTKLPRSGTHQDDLLDAAVLRIDGDAQATLRQFCLTINDLYPITQAHDLAFCVAGYPVKASRREGRVLIHNLRVGVLNGQPIALYEKLGLRPAEHIVMEFGKRIVASEGTAQAPALRGMSGGGVWILPALEKSHLPKKLIGIFIEARKTRAVAVGTSVAAHISLISQYHPELTEKIEKAETGQDFEDWLAQKVHGRISIKDIIPSDFHSLFEGWLK